jgi:hypothetical protein
MAALTNFFENKLVDFLFRGQALGLANTTAAAGTGPTSWWVGLLTALASDGSTGTEVSGGSYARVEIASSLVNWAGTQGETTTAVSSGTTGTTSNNAEIVFPVPTATWGTVLGLALYDSPSSGNMCLYAPLQASKNVGLGDPAPTFPISALSTQVDN